MSGHRSAREGLTSGDTEQCEDAGDRGDDGEALVSWHSEAIVCLVVPIQGFDHA
jgi:hypothetical protein